MKHVKFFVIVALMLLIMSPVIGQTIFEVDGICYKITSSVEPYEVSVGKNYDHPYSGDVVIPEMVDYNGNTYSVTSIGRGAFDCCTDLTSINISNSVTSIGELAFRQCFGLVSVTIGNSMVNIGNMAFLNCKGLTSVNIPSSVTSIEYEAFFGCKALTSISIPNSVTSIGENAFLFCKGLTSIVVASDNPKYDSRDNCNALIETKTNMLLSGCQTSFIPNSIVSIMDNAFNGCEGLTSIIIPSSVMNIGYDAFKDCKGLTSVVVASGNPKYDSRNNCNAIIETETNTLLFGCRTSTVPHSVASIGDYAFYQCDGLTSISFPNSLKSIGEYAFTSCCDLVSINIPNSLMNIGEGAFCNCDGLTSIDIPSSVTSIGAGAFSCPNMISIKVNPNNPVYDSRENCNAIIKTDSLILVQGCATTVIPLSVVSIGQYAFTSCHDLVSIHIPNSVMNIGESAFYNCEGLTYINIPYSLKTIGRYAFGNCTGLTNIEIPNSVTRIESRAFYNCTGLTSVTIGKSVNYVSNPFFDCTALREMKMKAITPPDLESWGVNRDEITLYVPCGCKEDYFGADYWSHFANIIDTEYLYDLDVISNDENLGSVHVIQQPDCESNVATVKAEPQNGRVFVHWSTKGHVVSTDNPYTFVMDDDIELMAHFSGTGVDEETWQEITVSPNPAKGLVNIECENIESVVVYSLDGRACMVYYELNADVFALDLTDLPQGIYILHIETSNGVVFNRKAIKE